MIEIKNTLIWPGEEHLCILLLIMLKLFLLIF